MLLNLYVAACLDKPGTPSARELRIPREALLTIFRNLRGTSEASGLERAVRLFWDGEALIADAPIASPTETAVDIGTDEIRHHERYIGDCHTHPYRQKMGPEAHIGPSTGDYEEWWRYPPDNFEMALHFVVSGSTVFLMLIRAGAKGWGGPPKFNCIDYADTERLNTYSREDEDMARVYLDTYGMERREKNRRLRQAWDRYVPQAAREFREDNMRMNIDLANYHICDYYSGEMDHAGRASACLLNLRSEPAIPGPG